MSGIVPGADSAPVPAPVKRKPAVAPKANGNGHADITTSDIGERILAFARDPNVDADKVKVFWDIQKDMLAEQRKERDYEARLVAFDAKAKAQREFPVIGRDAWNDQTKSYYARLETIWEICCPIWTKHGFGVDFPSIRTSDGLIQLSCHITHNSGWETTVTVPEAPSDNVGFKGTANKTVIQGNQSTISYLKRGLLCSAMGIVTANEDDDGNSGDRKLTQQTQQTGKPPTDTKRPPVDWVQRTFTLLDSAPSPQAWETTLSSALPGAPSATEVVALRNRLSDYIGKIPDRKARNRIAALFHDRIMEFGGVVSDTPSDKAHRSTKGEDADRAEAAEKAKAKAKPLTADEQWGEDQISELNGVWSMDVLLVMANNPETQARMKRMSADKIARPVFERVKAAYQTRQDFIAREAVR